MRRRHSPTYSAVRSATYPAERLGLSASLKCQARRFSSWARSRYPTFNQWRGESGFVVAYRRAPGTDRRASSWVQNPSGMRVASSTYASCAVKPRRRPSARVSAAPTRWMVRPRIVAVVAPRVWCTCLANGPNRAASCSGSKTFRSIVCKLRPQMMIRLAVATAITKASRLAIVLPLRTLPCHRLIRAVACPMLRSCLRDRGNRSRSSNAAHPRRRPRRRGPGRRGRPASGPRRARPTCCAPARRPRRPRLGRGVGTAEWRSRWRR